MLLAFLVSAGSSVSLMLTEVGRQALVDKWERTALAFGREVNDEQYEGLVAMTEHAPAYAVLSAAARGPVFSLAVAALLLVGFKTAPGGRVSYRQVLAVVAHAGIILALGDLVAAPYGFVRETLRSPATLAGLFTMFDEASPAARFLGAIDLFVVWWTIVLGIGVAVLFGRRPKTTIATLVGAYVGLAALLAIAMAVTGGTV